MKLLYHSDSYIKEIETTIENVNVNTGGFQFKETIIYPGGGGQPMDKGTVVYKNKEYPVTRIEKNKDGIFYFFENLIAQKDDKVILKIDWTYRYSLMKTHTCMHVLCGVIWRDYKKKDTGGNMEPLKARMDFEFNELNKEMLSSIEDAVNNEINKNHTVMEKIISSINELDDLIRTKENLLPQGLENIRLIEIENLDTQADGGTHVKKTVEIGRMKIVSLENKGKNNKRIKVEIINA